MRAHGPLVVMAAAFLERIGLPLPALIFLVLGGCLVVDGLMSFPITLAAATLGALIGDVSWYWIGWGRGRSALYFFCRLSLNPDSCVGRAESTFRTRTALTILTSKLIPGVSALVPALAGILGVSFWRYVLLDTAGSLLWASIGLGLGIGFGASIVPRLASIQSALAFLLIVTLLGLAMFRIMYRRRLIKNYSVPKIDSTDLLSRIQSGKGVLIVDLRDESAFARSAAVIPGAVRIPPARFDTSTHLLPMDKEIVLYCT